jgi:glycolate oxidase
MILFDVREQGVLDRVLEAGREILKVSVEAGGTISGEHGIGVEKNRFMPWIFSEADLEVMSRVRAAFDPTGSCNPGKVLPTASGCHDAYLRPRAAVAAGHPELWI